MTEEVPVTQARAAFADLINRVGYGGERIVLTKHGKPLVALVPASDLASVDTAANAISLAGPDQHAPEISGGSYEIAAHYQHEGPSTPWQP